MKQNLDLDLSKLRRRKMELLELIDSVVPWSELLVKLTAAAPFKATSRPPLRRRSCAPTPTAATLGADGVRHGRCPV